MAEPKADIDILLNLTQHSGTPSSIPMTWDKIDMFIQEVDILFHTDNYTVLCEPDGWPNLKSYIFRTNVSAGALQSKIQELISTQCPTSTDVNWSIDVGFVRGELHDIGIITLTIKVPEGADKVKEYYVG